MNAQTTTVKRTARKAVEEAGIMNAGPAKRKINMTPEQILARNKKISETRSRNSQAKRSIAMAAKVHTATGELSVFEAAKQIAEQLRSFSWNARPHKDELSAVSELRNVAEDFVKFFGKK